MELDKSYKIVFEIKGNILTYRCVIVSLDENFIEFIDDRGKKYTYNKKYIISSTQLDYQIKKEVSND